MFPNVGQCLIDLKAFPALEAVLDVVYNPFRTELLLRAEDCGVTAAGGFEMLVAQAVFAAEHFTGRQLDTAALIPAVSRRLRHELANVSIIGMPGCGKSTVGAALAKRLGKRFVDLDAEIERRTGHNIPDIFAQEGEAASAAMRRKCWPRLPRATAKSSPAAAGSSKIRPTPAPCARTARCCGCAARWNAWLRAGVPFEGRGCLKAAGSRAHTAVRGRRHRRFGE